MSRNEMSYFTGCLLGGAVGDALGWPVEFQMMDEIRELYGADGISAMVPGNGGLFEITDDTQMTLFTAEGLLQAWGYTCRCGEAPDFVGTVRRAYLRWLETQGEAGVTGSAQCGWLLSIEGLHRRRAPGDTCLSSLRDGSISGDGCAQNDSKGCGGVMRAAPAGLLAARIVTGDSMAVARVAFDIGCATAMITHGHPSGYYPAGVLAAIVATIIAGDSLEEGITNSFRILDDKHGSEETIAAIHAAVDLWRNGDVPPTPETVESLGEGWCGDEALAISLYCALVAGEDCAGGIRLAVNHSGDSDSTGSITGNLLGALLGEQALSPEWLDKLELQDVIRQVGEDLYTAFEGSERWMTKYQ